MQSIINSIVKNRNLIIYLILSFITFNFLYNNSTLHSNQLGKISTFLSATSSKLSSSLSSYFSLIEENEKLINENLKLKNIDAKYRLNQIVDNSLDSVSSAKVIVNSINKNKNIIIIDKGTLDGVNLESGVISPEGAVGIVKNVTKNYASIISLLNTDLKLNAVLQSSSTIGSISWDGINPKILKLNDIPLSSSLKVGDTVITGGMSFYFPKGILIGKIVNYDSNSLEGYYEIDVESFSDFSSLSNLYILNKGDYKEIKSLLNE